MSIRLAGCLVVALVAAPSCAATPIADLIQHPDAYANTVVTVEGTVTGQALGYLVDAAYVVRGADDYRIAVFGRGTPPAEGTHLVVTGTVGRKPPDEEFDFPPVIIESSRQTQ